MIEKPKVLLIGKPSNLGNSLIKTLSDNGYAVEVVIGETKIKNMKTVNDYRYIIWFTSSINKSVLNEIKTRTLLIIPYRQFSSTREILSEPNVTAVYIGDIWDSVQLNSITKEITKVLFSFGNGRQEIIISKDTKPTKPVKRVNQRRISLFGALAFFGLFLLPYFIFIISLPGFYLAYREARNGNLNSSQNILGIDSALLNLSNQAFSLYEKVPVVGGIFDPMIKLSIAAVRVTKLGQEGIDAVRISKDLVIKVLGKEVYSPSAFTNDLVLDLDDIYNQTILLRGDVATLPAWQQRIISGYVPETEVEDVISKLNWSRSFARQLPSILGEGSPQSYLLLLQNNMELRATGGFIGSFAIVNMDGGRLTDINVSDVYSADGQLKGHVEPPAPIKNYLGQAGWYLRDSNWDPDFPSSATKAEWFLEKEIGTSVSGVIAVDLEVAKSILKVTGPIKLADYNLTVDDSNLYERTQAEVENDFFPGSSQKSGFLTELTRELLNRVADSQQDEELAYFKSLYNNFQEKHIQVFLHNKDAQKFMSALGYDGAVVEPSCDGNCYADWMGIVDSNIGVNKSNLFIKRDVQLGVSFSAGSITRNLTINYENTATPALGDKARYKTYTRVLVPVDAVIQRGGVVSYGQVSPVQIDRQDLEGRSEIGILLELMPGEKKSIQLNWSTVGNLDFNSKGEYHLYIRKQAGTLADPIAIEIGTLDKYNTSLSQDLFRTVSW